MVCCLSGLLLHTNMVSRKHKFCVWWFLPAVPALERHIPMCPRLALGPHSRGQVGGAVMSNPKAVEKVRLLSLLLAIEPILYGLLHLG